MPASDTRSESPVGDGGASELPPHYYRDNFLQLCDTVEGRYSDLLLEEECDFLRGFRALDFRPQCLYVRLVSRVGPWFRESKLHYPEIGELGGVIDTLLAQGLLLQASSLTVEELGRLFTVQELRRGFAGLLPGLKTAGKRALLDAIDELEMEGAELLPMLAGVDATRVVAPLAAEQVAILQLLFFGNRRQSLTEFVLSDLGIARYYPYALDREQRLFPHRQALDEYLDCAALGDIWYETQESGGAEELIALADEMMRREVIYPSSERRWYRLCNSVARELERQAEPVRAYELYARSRQHPARERRARLLERAGDWAAAVALCNDILTGPWCEEEQEAAVRILPRARRKLDGSRAARRRDQFEEVTLRLAPGDVSVERLVAAHLQPDWKAVRYVENKLMNALFGLAFWEQIFAPSPGAFHNPYQSAPADMYEPGFRARREDAIAARLTRLQQLDLAQELSEAYLRYSQFQSRWIDWRRIDVELVRMAGAVIPAAHLLAVWQRILFDPRENRRGFPDLVALGEQPGDYCLIEVKGPGDALQDSQRRWLRFFQEQDMPAQVAWVVWRDD